MIGQKPTRWDGPYHDSVSRSRIMIRVSLPVHICDHDKRRRYGYGDMIGQMIRVWTRLNAILGLNFPTKRCKGLYQKKGIIGTKGVFYVGICLNSMALFLNPLTAIVLCRRQKIIAYIVVRLCCLVIVMALRAEKRLS
jgi:hypothetical protein